MPICELKKRDVTVVILDSLRLQIADLLRRQLKFLSRSLCFLRALLVKLKKRFEAVWLGTVWASQQLKLKKPEVQSQLNLRLTIGTLYPPHL